MTDSKLLFKEEKEVVQEKLTDVEIWKLCKERAAELNVPAWQVAESLTWH